MGTVHDIDVIPKTEKGTYKGYDYVISYVPKTRLFSWSVTKVTTISHSDEATSFAEARKQALKMIDSMTSY